MLGKRAAITSATAVEFRVPAVETPGVGSPAFNTVIQLDATASTRKVQGLGEGARRGPAITGDTAAGSWRFLRAALKRVEGLRVSLQPKRARAEIAVTINELGRLAVDMSRTGGAEPSYRGTLTGLDIALVDLAARAVDVPFAHILGERQHAEQITVAGVSAGLPRRKLSHEIISAGAHSVVKLVDLAGREAALEVLSVAADAAGPNAPLWLDLSGRLAHPDALKLVETLVDKIRAGELPPHVVLQRPVDAAHRVGLTELQAAADAGIGEVPGPGLVIMADAWSAADALALADGGVRGVDLNLYRLGGTLAVLETVRELRVATKDVRVCLSTVPGVFGIAARALAALSTALPTVHYLELPKMIGDINVVAEEDEPSTRGQAGDGPGLGIRLALAPAVGHVTRRVEVPTVPPRPLTYGRLRANEFDIEPIRGFATLNWGIPLTNHLLERAALARGLNTMRLWNGVFVASHADLPEPIGFAMRRSGWTGVSARRVADDKELSRRMLRAAGVPAPRGAAFHPDDVEQAVEFARSLDAPAVVKPRDGSHGIGVATDLLSEPEVRNAISALRQTKYASRDFIVEEYVAGNYYRFLVIGNQVVSVVLCRPGQVVGNGRSTIVDLVLEKNLVRLKNPHMHTRLIELGSDAAFWLDRQGLAIDSVPGDSQVVRIGSVGNVAGGGDSIDVLDETDESLLDLAVRATQAVPGLDHCGVDLIGDHSRPASGQAASIVEVNSAPGTVLNHFPMFGTPRDVSSELVLRSCELMGYTPAGTRDELSVRIEVFGLVEGVGYRHWFARLADERGLVGSIRNLPSGSVEVYVSGPAAHVAALASRAFVGPRRAFVDRVVTTHVAEVQPGDRFEVFK